MELEKVIKLIDAGFTKDEISKFEISEDEVSPIIPPLSISAEEAAGAPAEDPGPVSSNETNSNFDIESINNQIAGLTKAISEMRGFLAKTASMPAPAGLSENVDKITADIISGKVR